MSWNPTRFSSYGPVPGYQSPSLSLDVGLAQSLGWRGKRVDETGYINLGARLYDPVAGRFISADPLGHAASQDLYSFCGGDPVNRFDPDGRCVSAAANFAYNGGAAGYGLRQLGGYLDSYNNSSAGGGYFTGFSGTVVNELAGMTAPSTYVNGLAGFGNNVSTIYNDGGFLPAASYATSGWNVGQVYSGLANLDLVTGEEVGDWYQRGTAISGGVASTAGVASGGLGLYDWAVAPATVVPADVPPVIQPSLTPVQMLQNLTDQTTAQLAANPSLANTVLSPAEVIAAQGRPFLNPMAFGNALERLVAQQVRNSPQYRSMFRYVGGPSNPDFVGIGAAEGMNFDITTPGQVGAHLARPLYGEGLNVITYQRSPGWTVPPPATSAVAP